MSLERLLFASVHGYADPSSGEALATRDLLELLAARGVDCRVLCTGALDFQEETSPEAVLDPLGVAYERLGAELPGGGEVGVIDLTLGGVRVTVLPTASSLPGLRPDAGEGAVFLGLAAQALERFRPGPC